MFASPRGRVALAIAIGAIVVLVLAVRRSTAPAPKAASTSSTTLAPDVDPALDVGVIPPDVYAPPIPPGGFNFQNLGGDASAFDALQEQLDGIGEGFNAQVQSLQEELAAITATVAGIQPSGSSNPTSTVGTTGGTGPLTQPTNTVSPTTAQPTTTKVPAGVYRTGTGRFFWRTGTGNLIDYENSMGTAERATVNRIVKRAADAGKPIGWVFRGQTHLVYSTGTVRPT